MSGTGCQHRQVADLAPVLADLVAESTDLDALVADLDPDTWALATPAEGWTIAHQVAHLAWTDEVATTAICDPPGFEAVLGEAMGDPFGFVDAAADKRSTESADRLLSGWRAGRAALADALRGVPEGAKIAWFGPPMSAPSMATARLMETWAHGLDVADALGIVREPTDRLRHVAHLGVRTRDFAFLIRDLPVPAEAFRVELTAPSGGVWTWGPDGRNAAGDRFGARLLPARHATATAHRTRRRRHRSGRRAVAGDRAGLRGTTGAWADRCMIRIGNCSGFYGDRASAMHEMLDRRRARRAHRRLPG